MIRHFRQTNDGTVSLEMCLVTPMFLFIFIAIFDFGFLLFQQMEVQAAADAGAAFAMVEGVSKYNNSTIASVIASAAYPTQGSITGSASTTPICACPNGTAGITVVAGSTCSGLAKCSNGFEPGYYVLVSAQVTPTPIFNWPGYPATIQSGLVVRIQ